MNSFTSDFLANLRFSPADLSTVQTLGTFQGRQELFRRQIPETLDTLRSTAQVESVESSNRIEGVRAPHGQIKKIVLGDATPRNRSEQEIAGYRDVLRLIHDRADEIPITPNVILQFHQTIYNYHASEGGNWKSTDNAIVEKDGKGNVVRVRFRATPAIQTPQAIDDLCHRFGSTIEDSEIDSLVAIPLLILDYLCIHPFRDGNGRTARLLTLLVLYRSGYEVGRFISLERIVEDTREGYYEALEQSSRGWRDGGHDPLPWMRYFWGVLTSAYREFEERVGSVDRSKGSKSQRVRDAVLRQALPFSISELEVLSPGISRETVRAVLREMKESGQINLVGKGRGAKWVVCPTLME